MTAAILAPMFAAFVAAVAMIWQTRINAKSTGQTSLDVRAQKTLELALKSQGDQILALAAQVEVQAHQIVELEREVEACEVGRRADRQAWAAEVDALRAEIRTLRPDG